MARLRFPGRPGFRFDRLGVKYGVDEPNKGLDPTTRLIANIHRGLRYFRELFGDSDEEEEFEGFTRQDVLEANQKLQELIKETEKVENKQFVHKAQIPDPANISAKPKRTKQVFQRVLETGTVQNVSRKIHKLSSPEGKADVGKLKIKLSLSGHRGKIVQTAAAKERLKRLKEKEKEKKRKMKEKEKIRLEKLKAKLKKKKEKEKLAAKKKKMKMKVVSSKKIDHTVAKQLLFKARGRGRPRKHPLPPMPVKGKDKVQTTPPGGKAKLMPSSAPKVFRMPAVSSRSSRKIKPTKRFYEEEFDSQTPPKKVRSAGEMDGQAAADPSPSPVIPERAYTAVVEPAQTTPALPTPTLPKPAPAGVDITPKRFEEVSPNTKSMKLFEAPLVVEGKRQRKPSLKLIRTITDDEDPYAEAAKEEPAEASLAGSDTQSDKNKPTNEAVKRSGQSILRKAKFQLNRAALNRSKADLARSLKRQMKKEMGKTQKPPPGSETGTPPRSLAALTHPEFGSSPLKSSPFALYGAAIISQGWHGRGRSTLFSSSSALTSPSPSTSSAGQNPFLSAMAAPPSGHGIFGDRSLFSPATDSPGDLSLAGPQTSHPPLGISEQHCIVCGFKDWKNKNHGITKGMPVCNPCYRFFMRRFHEQILDGREFKCRFNNKCSISCMVRSNCMCCRYRRCCQVLPIPLDAAKNELKRHGITSDIFAKATNLILAQWQEAASYPLPKQLSYENFEVDSEKVEFPDKGTKKYIPARKDNSVQKIVTHEDPVGNAEPSAEETLPTLLSDPHLTSDAESLPPAELLSPSQKPKSQRKSKSPKHSTLTQDGSPSAAPKPKKKSKSPRHSSSVVEVPVLKEAVPVPLVVVDVPVESAEADLLHVGDFGEVSDALIDDILKSSDDMAVPNLHDISMETDISTASSIHISPRAAALVTKQPVVTLEALSPWQLPSAAAVTLETEHQQQSSFIDALETLTSSSSGSLSATTSESRSCTSLPSIIPDSPEAGTHSRGPRIKHVCRKAAVALGRATFPVVRPELRLSALPPTEKTHILEEDEYRRPGTPDSDDMSMEEIIRRARNEGEMIPAKPSSNKALKALMRRPKKIPGAPPATYARGTGLTLSGNMRKRKMPCRKCDGCLRPPCGVCAPCRDRVSAGGPGRLKQRCSKRVCSDPIIPIHRLPKHSVGPPPSLDPTEPRQHRVGISSTYSKEGLRNRDENQKHDDMMEHHKSELHEHGMPPMVTQMAQYGSHPSKQSLFDKPAPTRLLTKFDIRKKLKFAEKEAALRGDHSDTFMSPPLQTVKRYKWPSGSNVNHFIQATFEEDYSHEVAWQQGMALISSNPMCVRTVCFLCGSAGKHELIFCNVCCEPFHSFCLDESERPGKENLENWCCRRCQFCHVCGKQQNAYVRPGRVANIAYRLLRCDKCHDTYHPECLGPNYPTRPSKNKNIWVCTKCVKCRSCGATTPGTAKNAVWMHDFSLCYECGQLMEKGNFCPVCQKCYYDDDWDCKMVQCSTCDAWVHAKCEGLTDERYQLLSFLPEDVMFNCRVCHPQRPAPWDQVIDQEMTAGFGHVLQFLQQSKSSHYLDAIEDDAKLEKPPDKPIKSILSKSKKATPAQPALKQTVYKTRHTALGFSEHKQETPLQQLCAEPQTATHISDTSSHPVSVEASEPSLSTDHVAIETSCAEETSVSDSAPDTPGVIDSSVTSEGSQGRETVVTSAGSLGKETPVTSEGSQGKETPVTSEGHQEEGNESHTVAMAILEDIISKVCNRCGVSSQLAGQSHRHTAVEEHESGPTSMLHCTNQGSQSVDQQPTTDCETGEVVSASSSQPATSTSPTPHDATSDTSVGTDGVHCDMLNCDSQPGSSSESPSGGVLQRTGQSDTESQSNMEVDQSHMENLEANSQPRDINQIVSDTTATFGPISVDTGQHHVTFDLREFHDHPRISPPSSRSPSATLTGDEVVPESFSDFSDQEGPAKVPKVKFGTCSPVKIKKKPKYYPLDLAAVLEKIQKSEYATVENFCDDLVRIIQYNLSLEDKITVTKRKALATMRSMFIKEMNHCFPWFDVKLSRLWMHNQSFPKDMLPDAVLPPNSDHTYAQWLAREKTPSSPSPSPFKKPYGTPRKSPVASLALGDGLGYCDDQDQEPEDTRRCLFCSHLGDAAVEEAGRLLYAGQDDWVHVNCTLWSAEVYEELDGTLQNVSIAITRARKLRCDRCHRVGATVGCCLLNCSRNYHFMCARMDECVFQEDKRVFCRSHRQCVDGKLLAGEAFSVLRRSCIKKDLRGKYLKKNWSRGLPPDVVNVVAGSMTVESLGYLSPLSDRKGALYPLNFCITRIYWSTFDVLRRCVYTCRILEVRPDEQNEVADIKDMTIAHDTSHPNYDPRAVVALSRRLSVGSNVSMSSVMDSESSSISYDQKPDKREAAERMEDSSSAWPTDLMEGTGDCYDTSMPTMGSELLQMLAMGGSDGEDGGDEDTRSQDGRSIPSQQPSSRTSSRSSSVDLSNLAPRTREMLSSVDLSHCGEEPSSQQNDLCLSTKLVDRLNKAAARNARRFSQEDCQPKTGSTSLPSVYPPSSVQHEDTPVLSAPSADMFTVTTDGISDFCGTSGVGNAPPLAGSSENSDVIMTNTNQSPSRPTEKAGSKGGGSTTPERKSPPMYARKITSSPTIDVPLFDKDGNQIGVKKVEEKEMKTKVIPRLKGSNFPGVNKSHKEVNIETAQSSSSGISQASEPEPMDEDLPGQLDGTDDRSSTRRTRASKSEDSDLRDKIAMKIKAESLARSNTAQEGPFKCPSCKRLYRTVESLERHIHVCDFVVSSDDEEEEEEPEDGDDDNEVAPSVPLKTYPLRGRGNQPTEELVSLPEKKKPRSQLNHTPPVNNSASGKVTPMNNSPSVGNSTDSVGTKRRRGRPRLRPPSPEALDPEPVPEVYRTMRGKPTKSPVPREMDVDGEAADSLASRASTPSSHEDDNAKKPHRRGRSSGLLCNSSPSSASPPQTLRELAAGYTNNTEETPVVKKRGRPRKYPPVPVAQESPSLRCEEEPETIAISDEEEDGKAKSAPPSAESAGQISREPILENLRRELQNAPSAIESATTNAHSEPADASHISMVNGVDDPGKLCSPSADASMEAKKSSPTESGKQMDVNDSVVTAPAVNAIDTTPAKNAQVNTAQVMKVKHSPAVEQPKVPQPAQSERVTMSGWTSSGSGPVSSIPLEESQLRLHLEESPVKKMPAISSAAPTLKAMLTAKLHRKRLTSPSVTQAEAASASETQAEDVVYQAESRVIQVDQDKALTGSKMTTEHDAAQEAHPIQGQIQLEVTGSGTTVLSGIPERGKPHLPADKPSQDEIEVINIDDDDDEDEEIASKSTSQQDPQKVHKKSPLPTIIRRRSAQELMTDSKVVRIEVTDAAQKAELSKMNYETVKLASGRTVKMIRMSSKELSSKISLEAMPNFREALKSSGVKEITKSVGAQPSASVSQSNTPASVSVPQSNTPASVSVPQSNTPVSVSVPQSISVPQSKPPTVTMTDITRCPKQSFAAQKSPPLPTRTVQHVIMGGTSTGAHTQHTQPNQKILPKPPTVAPPVASAVHAANTSWAGYTIDTSSSVSMVPTMNPSQGILGSPQPFLSPQGSQAVIQGLSPQGSQAVLQGVPVQGLISNMMQGLIIPTGHQSLESVNLMPGMTPLIAGQTVMSPPGPAVIPLPTASPLQTPTAIPIATPTPFPPPAVAPVPTVSQPTPIPLATANPRRVLMSDGTTRIMMSQPSLSNLPPPQVSPGVQVPMPGVTMAVPQATVSPRGYSSTPRISTPVPSSTVTPRIHSVTVPSATVSQRMHPVTVTSAPVSSRIHSVTVTSAAVSSRMHSVTVPSSTVAPKIHSVTSSIRIPGSSSLLAPGARIPHSAPTSSIQPSQRLHSLPGHPSEAASLQSTVVTSKVPASYAPVSSRSPSIVANQLASTLATSVGHPSLSTAGHHSAPISISVRTSAATGSSTAGHVGLPDSISVTYVGGAPPGLVGAVPGASPTIDPGRTPQITAVIPVSHSAPPPSGQNLLVDGRQGTPQLLPPSAPFIKSITPVAPASETSQSGIAHRLALQSHMAPVQSSVAQSLPHAAQVHSHIAHSLPRVALSHPHVAQSHPHLVPSQQHMVPRPVRHIPSTLVQQPYAKAMEIIDGPVRVPRAAPETAVPGVSPRLIPLDATGPACSAAPDDDDDAPLSSKVVLATLSKLLQEGAIREPQVVQQLNTLITQFNETQSLTSAQQDVLGRIEKILKSHLRNLTHQQQQRQRMKVMPPPAVHPPQFPHQSILQPKVPLYERMSGQKRKRSGPQADSMIKRRVVTVDQNGVIQNQSVVTAPTIDSILQKGHLPHNVKLLKLTKNKELEIISKYKKKMGSKKGNKNDRKGKSPLKAGHLSKKKSPRKFTKSHLLYEPEYGGPGYTGREDPDWVPHRHQKLPEKPSPVLRQDEELHGALHSHTSMHQHIAPHLPQPAQEEEVVDTPLTAYEDKENGTEDSSAAQNRPHLVFEITSDDGFHVRANSWNEAWQAVTDKVQDARQNARLKQLSYNGVNGLSMYGLNQNSMRYLLEQLYGANNCRYYKFRYFKYDQAELEEEPPENPSGCARGEPFKTRKPYDVFSFLMSQYRMAPVYDESAPQNVDIVHKSQRRATSMDLPYAMRFRHLKEHAKEAVGVYRSLIHGRGLFCKRDIDSGEMIIEYAGEIIRSQLTDKRESYYESKGIGCYMFRIDDFDVVDATMHGNAARFINHSCDPNCYSKVINIEGKKHIIIFALRPIKRSEELTYDYKFPIEDVKIPCTCSARRCRKYLN